MIISVLLNQPGIQSALEPAGVHAAKIADLWTIFLVVCDVVYVLVMLALLAALLRRRSSADAPETKRGATTVVTVATAATTVILFVLLTASILTGRGIAEVAHSGPQIMLTGHQWWWQVDYEDPDPSKRISSANEIYVPVGIPVKIKLHSSDVIHSFWAPNLHGKRDLIPGHDGSITIQADRPGVFRGQCAEFCGVQHAKMSFWITALAPADFARWADAQRRSSKIPSTPEQRRGEEVFMSSPCPLCHNIQGTEASGRTGPDLTHFASRRSIAAGVLPNRRGYLAGWILDPQHIKPGTQMPPMALQAKDVEPLIDYLESLQ